MPFMLKPMPPRSLPTNQPFEKLLRVEEKPPASLPPKPEKLPSVFAPWPAFRLPPKPSQPGVQYVMGADWAWAGRPPRHSAATTKAKPNLTAKMDIRATTNLSGNYTVQVPRPPV